ncbi:arabinosyltransferase domain-containing protein [Nocardia suismassiliense]|uniref:arabinosyltransferase domain-containing protein n=1 Tax=Nocardia suismassiliense TaxID=2077092 RepID=UPI000D1F7FCC|nr:arabinosyltransferase domain-containing protein [Nocardia suismassiliense]
MTVSDAVRESAQPSAPQEPQDSGAHRGVARRIRLLAIVSGLLAMLAAASIPFLPVEQDQSSVAWPQTAAVTSVTAPLLTYAPMDLSAEIPCAAFDALADSGGVVVSTIPRQSPDLERYGFVVKVVPDAADRAGRVDVVSRNTLLWSSPLSAVRNGSCAIHVTMDTQRTTVTATGVADSGKEFTTDIRPQVVGVFSDLTGAAPAGLQVNVQVDSRFSASPTPLKLAAIVLAVLATLVALVALYRLDSADGRKSRRFLPTRWWRLQPADYVVFATLLVWHFIGANTSDDGYILGMARASQSSGFMSNYYRWFSVDEGPFYTPYTDMISLLTHVSSASPWVRLPTLLVGVFTWWVISREILPRLGIALRFDKIVVWTSALVFLAFWMPYNNGLRAEPFVALGVILTWASVERSIATRRLLPYAFAIIIAALTLTVAPSGLICVGALAAGARTVTAVIVQRAKSAGYLALLLPLLAAGLAVLTVVFADRTLAGALEMFYVHGRIGPGESWFFEFLRYQYLLQINADGWLTRRFGMFMLLLGLAVCVVTMLRRGGRIPGTALGPGRRLVGITVAAMVLMMFSPTKWTHQFGVFAGLAACVAALTAVSISPAVMRPLRNRALFATAVFFALALTFVGANGYWYVSAWGIPWWDKPPTFAGFGLSTFAAGLSVLALAVAAWFHIRPETQPRAGSVPGRIARVPVLAVVAAAMVAFEVLSFAKAAVAQYPSYSMAQSNLSAAFSGGCGLADKVLIETDPNASVLPPLAGDAATALAGAESTGFTPNGVATDLTSDEVESTTGKANSVASADSDDTADPKAGSKSPGSEAGTSGAGINGSSVPLPFGLDPATTPVLGSYREGNQVPAELTTGWYRLPNATNGSRGDIISIAVAGRIRHVDSDGIVHPGQDLRLEYGRAGSDGTAVALGSVDPIDIGPSPSWRNMRVPLDQLPGDADVVRIVASDKDLGKDQWLAVTPPRVPQTKTMTAVVGSRTPVLLDWEVVLNFPCQNLVPTHAGVGDLPTYRILPDRNGATITNLWQDHNGGGPLGWTQLLFTARALPTYLDQDWDRDWGSIEQYLPLDPNAQPAKVTIDETQRWGTWTPGHINTAW